MKIAAIIAFALAIAPDAAHAAGIRVFADQADTARAMEGEEVLSICNSNCQHSMDECYDDSMGNNHNDGCALAKGSCRKGCRAADSDIDACKNI